jgi:proline racemase
MHECRRIRIVDSPIGGSRHAWSGLYADGKVRQGQTSKQDGIVGNRFEGRVKVHEGQGYPRIKGSALLNAPAELVLDPLGPLGMGIRT